MSYEVTATRRRPQAFEALAGQEFVAETLKNSIQSEKIAHAYLFSGPRGCGKTSTARILAKALNCAEGPTATPCGKCQQCLEITKGQSTDVIEIDGASNTSVNDIRQIKDEVLFPPQSSRYKIYIIDEVHMLSTSAFNALLKTIEEPPPYVIFIFATTELHKVPATIKSRCQQFNFRLVPIETVKEQLAQAAAEIGIQAEDEALYWVARESTGSMRDAYTLFDQVAAFSGDKITYEKIRDKLGLVGVERLNAIFEDCAQNKSQDALLKIDEFLQNGISIEQFISNCTDYLRSLLLIRAGITKEALLGNARERFSEIVLKAWNPIQLERALSILLQLFRDIRYSLSPRYELELAFSRLSWLSEYVSPSEVKKALDEAKALLLGNASAQVVKTAPQPAQVQTPAANPVAPAQVVQSAAVQNVQQIQNVQPVQNGSVQNAPRNIFAQAASSTSAQPAQSAPVQNAPKAIPTFSALAGMQSAAPTDFSNQPPVSDPEMDENFAPPDPTPQDLPPQSFSNGGAVPPEQTEADGTDEPGDFRSRVLKQLSIQEPMLAGSLYQTGPWLQNGNLVTTVVQSTYLKMQLDSNQKKISEFLTKFCGQQTNFQVNLLQQQRVNLDENAPEEVKLLCSIFKGQIVGHSKKTDQEIAADSQKKQEIEQNNDSESQAEEIQTDDAEENE
ncbi:MAG: DNA polymerase III subunit gamma/tau [Treponema sp.]|nr:DNA polymerase III subunit gamma/tau [Candidatus Treponema equifaecale]